MWKDKIWSSFVCFGSLSLSQPIHLFNASCGFQKYQNRFNQKLFKEKSGSNNYLFLLKTHLSKKGKNLLLNSHFSTTRKLKLKVTWEYSKSYRLIKLSKGNR